MASEFMELISVLCAEKGIDKDMLIDTIKHALVTAYKRKYNTNENVEVTVNELDGSYSVYSVRDVVEEVENEDFQISLTDAVKFEPAAVIGDVIKRDVTPSDFGRMAVQNARQVIEQKLKEAERDSVYNEFYAKLDEIIMGTVQRVEFKEDKTTHEMKRTVFVNLGKTDSVMYEKDQIKSERYKNNARLPVYVYAVENTPKGPRVNVSRSHPSLVLRLLEKEIPELADGSIIVKAIAREAGVRTKIAVYSRLENVDPVGTCIGNHGMRIMQVINDLHGEKIDIIAWDKDERKFIERALSPAHIEDVIMNSAGKQAIAVVPDNDLSVAIGKEGINARLAAKLTGIKIDIRTKSEIDAQKELEYAKSYGKAEDDIDLDTSYIDLDEMGDLLEMYNNNGNNEEVEI
ncbi:MAG: transcription termination/antitermination protein NusA [Clostridiales bacterium]|nr:transcription termination/antitermination protein NusA [Clostridiales bacterium]